MNPRKFIIGFFTNWARPLFLFAFSLIFLTCAESFSDNIRLKNIAFYLCCFSVLPIIFSIIYQLVKRRFLISILTFGALVVGAILFFYLSIMAFLKEQSMPDHYADKLTIPTNIKINRPSDTSFSPSNILPDFELYDAFQSGLYGYAVWLNKTEKGYCYLKAFEITHNNPLSVDELKEKSKIEVFNPTDSVMRFGMGLTAFGSDRIFTIYEGDWGKPYAARFEVWFVPANSGQERKIAEKNFKIEGWMR